MQSENGTMSTQGRQTTIGEDTKVTLRTVWSVVAILVPVAIMMLTLYDLIQEVRSEVKAVNASVHAIQAQVSDRWTRSMMLLFASELESKNRHASPPLVVPNPEDIANKLPTEYSKPRRTNLD